MPTYIGARPVLVAAVFVVPCEDEGKQEPRGREHADGLSRAGQAGAVGQHKEAPVFAQAGDGGNGGVEGGGARALGAGGAPLKPCKFWRENCSENNPPSL